MVKVKYLKFQKQLAHFDTCNFLNLSQTSKLRHVSQKKVLMVYTSFRQNAVTVDIYCPILIDQNH